jgi:hypothetical protein
LAQEDDKKALRKQWLAEQYNVYEDTPFSEPK